MGPNPIVDVPLYHRNRLAHIHIPKTGGSAIEQLFMGVGDLEQGFECLFGDEFVDGRWYELHHLTIQELRARSEFEEAKFPRTFAVVRDPYQRLISDYRWRLRIDRETPHPAVAAFDSFEEFVQEIPIDLATRWDDHIAGSDRARANLLIHVRPQYHFVTVDGGSPDDGVEIVRFEQFPDSLADVLAATSVEWGHITGTTTRRHRIADYFDNDTLRVVNRIYARDFGEFDYPMITRIVAA